MSMFQPANLKMVIHETPLESFRFDDHGNFIVELDDAKERRLRVTFLSVISLEVTLEDCVDLTDKGVPIGFEQYILFKGNSERIARMTTPYEKRNLGDNLMKRVKHYAMLVGDYWVEVIALGYTIERV